MEILAMSGKERRRLVLLSKVVSGELKLAKAAELLKVSYRQTKRLLRRYREQGDAGLVHGLRGKASNRQFEPLRKERALALYREKYLDYGPTLAAECMTADDGLALRGDTLRRWLAAAGLWQRSRQRKVHRRKRLRRSCLGELVQMDGSHHDWFAGRRDWAVLMVMIDDATSTVYARFFENESWDSAARTFRQYVQMHGLPRALYVDGSGIYRADREPTPDEILAEIRPKTQFGRAMSELAVELIPARSPQAKGRVERVNRTLQDRLVKAMTRAGVSDIDAANRFLEETYFAAFNQKFGVTAAEPSDVHRVLADEALLRRLSQQEERVVMNDWTLRWHNALLQLGPDTAQHVQPGQTVTMSQQLDGRLRVFVGEQELAWAPAGAVAEKPAAKRSSKAGPPASNQGQKPAADHPWRNRSKWRQLDTTPAAPGTG